MVKTIAVLPFNAGANVSPELSRQMTYFLSDLIREHTGLNINAVNYMAQVEENPPRFANINPSEKLNERDMISEFMQQTEVEHLIDGLLEKVGDQYSLTYRIFEADHTAPVASDNIVFDENGIFGAIREIVVAITTHFENPYNSESKDNLTLFGTENASAFIDFLIGYDTLQYFDRSQGQITLDFSPKSAIDHFLAAIQKDAAWEGPYLALVQLCRLAIQLKIGEPAELETALTQIKEQYPQDSRGIFALGELYESVGNFEQALKIFEEAQTLEPNEPAIIARIGIVYQGMNMPANAEKQFRKAMELEGNEKPTADLLAQVLVHQSRGHEVPQLWKEIIDLNNQNAQAHTKYALSMLQLNQKESALRAFNQALEVVEDNLLIKRYYAPVLVQDGDFDTAMDYYEDCLDADPTNVQIMVEYAQTLASAKREFEIPPVLKNILNSNPEPDLKAQVLAWLIELEQPQRTEFIKTAQDKINADQYQEALSELQPLQTWLADYWKLWALLALVHNRMKNYEEAEKSAIHLLNMYPGCEPGYSELMTSLSAQGKHEEAYSLMRGAALRISNSLPIAINLALAAKRSGRTDEAKSLTKQIKEAVGEQEELKPIYAELEA